MQDLISEHIKRMRNFLNFTKNYFIRHNPIESFIKSTVASLKDMLSLRKKKRLVQYRLNYQLGKLKQMEKLIAANNDHVFLKGRKFNETR